GNAPAGEQRVDTVLAVLRAAQVWGGRTALPGLRASVAAACDLDEGERDQLDEAEELTRRLVAGMDAAGWDAAKASAVTAEVLGREVPDVVRVLDFAATELVPRLDRTTDEVANVLHALDGGYVPAGPSGSPTRGLVNVLPTGRNFYSVDPKG